MRSEDVIGLLKARYAAPEWVVLEQVANGTGSRARRWADAVAMNLWPSRGMEIHGIEVKVSRSDWLSEMKNPEKADVVASYCDRWWLAVGDRTIVRDGELPPTWGLVCPTPDGARLEVMAEALPLTPVALSRSFVAAILRRAGEQVTPEARFRREVAEAVGVERERWESRDHERRNDQYETLRKQVQAFEDASGLKITDPYPGPERLGLALRRYLEDPDTFLKQARGLASQIQDLADLVHGAVSNMEGKPPRGAF